MSILSGHRQQLDAPERFAIDPASLRQRIGRDVFDYQALMDNLSPLRKPRDKISSMIAAGDIIRVRKGLYVFAERFRRSPVCREVLANLIHGPSYVSLEYALSYHGLIPERVMSVTSVCTGRSRRFDTPFGAYTYLSLTLERYSWGAELHLIDDTGFLLAGPAKALADTVWKDKRFAGMRAGDYGPYLFDDLRVDPERLGSIPVQDFRRTALAYDSAKIDRLVDFISRFEEQPHA
jgi:hypothetical protein